MVKFRRGYRSKDVEYRGSAGRGPELGAGVGGAGSVGFDTGEPSRCDTFSAEYREL